MVSIAVLHTPRSQADNHSLTTFSLYMRENFCEGHSLIVSRRGSGQPRTRGRGAELNAIFPSYWAQLNWQSSNNLIGRFKFIRGVLPNVGLQNIGDGAFLSIVLKYESYNRKSSTLRGFLLDSVVNLVPEMRLIFEIRSNEEDNSARVLETLSDSPM